LEWAFGVPIPGNELGAKSGAADAGEKDALEAAAAGRCDTAGVDVVREGLDAREGVIDLHASRIDIVRPPGNPPRIP
jgi:hypothetical protein